MEDEMSKRHLRVVGPEGHEPFATTTDPSREVSLVDETTPDQDPSVSDAEAWIRARDATRLHEIPDGSRPPTDPNTGETIVHPSLRGHGPRAPEPVDRPAVRTNGRLRDYLRLVEGP